MAKKPSFEASPSRIANWAPRGSDGGPSFHSIWSGWMKPCPPAWAAAGDLPAFPLEGPGPPDDGSETLPAHERAAEANTATMACLIFMARSFRKGFGARPPDLVGDPAEAGVLE